MASRETYAMPLGPQPPSDIGTYSRSMLQHTKRQMDAVNSSSQSSLRGSQGGPSSGPIALPNGVGVGLGARGRNPSEYSYQA